MSNHRGEISVYATGIIVVFFALISVVIYGIHRYESKAKCYQAVAASVESVKGDYQPELFRRYHLLAIDQTYNGLGEAYMEERIRGNLDYNLNSSNGLYKYSVEEVAITEVRHLNEENLPGMKRQIDEYMGEKLPVDIVRLCFDELKQGKLSEQKKVWTDVKNNVTSSESSETFDARIHELDIVSENELENMGILDAINADEEVDASNMTVGDLITWNSEKQKLRDPRASSDSMRNGILSIVMPEHADSISTEKVDISNVPSSTYDEKKLGPAWTGVIPSFIELQSIAGFADSGMNQYDFSSFENENYDENALLGYAYALDSFSAAYNDLYTPDQEYHAFEYELEYILVGKESDSENLKRVANELIWIRMIPNLAYAITSKDMQSAAELAATVILVPIDMEFLIKPVTYVFLVCWAYGESIYDVKQLFQGKSVPVIKDQGSWNLSLNGIAEIAVEEAASGAESNNSSSKGNEIDLNTNDSGVSTTDFQEKNSGTKVSEGGIQVKLNYQEYVLLLLALQPDKDLKYYRMLDVMELNIQKTLPEFEMNHCIYEFHEQVHIREGEQDWYIEGKGVL